MCVAAWLVAACGVLDAAEPPAGPRDEQPEVERSPQPALRGVALSPRSYEPDEFTAFLELAAAAGDVLAHVGDWRQLLEPSNPFDTVMELARRRDMTPLVVVSASSAGQLLRPLDETETEEFLSALSAFAERHRPDYLGIGNEVNMLATDDPEGFAAWLQVWPRAAEAVHAVSADTIVFPVLQYEWLLGRRDGMFGREIVDAEWELLGRFPGADAIGITTFPGLVHAEPEGLDDDYYRRLAQHTRLPVLVTETGWPADETLPANPGSEEAQARFVERLPQLMADGPVELVVWPFVYDTLVEQEAFASYGLRRPDGSARPSWERWIGSAP